MLGCMFALDRDFFFKIGTFDTQMEIWGAENLEISFRVIPRLNILWYTVVYCDILSCSVVYCDILWYTVM